MFLPFGLTRPPLLLYWLPWRIAPSPAITGGSRTSYLAGLECRRGRVEHFSTRDLPFLEAVRAACVSRRAVGVLLSLSRSAGFPDIDDAEGSAEIRASFSGSRRPGSCLLVPWTLPGPQGKIAV